MSDGEGKMRLPGYLVEGTLRCDDGTWYIENPEQDIPVGPMLERYEDQDVRFILAGIAELRDLVENQLEEDGDDESEEEDIGAGDGDQGAS